MGRALKLRELIRPGDVLILLGLIGITALSFGYFWQGGRAERAVIRSQGRIVAEYALDQARQFRVHGPLGITVIEIAPGQARIAADPSPRQYCVQQGWLTRPGAVALCAPNQVSLSLEGSDGPAFDTLNY